MIDKSKLKELALAAEKDGQHIYMNPRDSNEWRANSLWHEAASPEAFLELLAELELARNAALEEAAKACESQQFADGDSRAKAVCKGCAAAVRSLATTTSTSAPAPSAKQEPSASEATKAQAKADLMPRREAFIKFAKSRGLDTSAEKKGPWGEIQFAHPHIESMWYGWFHAFDVAPASASAAPAAPGMHAAADYIDALAQRYLDEHASTEPDTGATVFKYGEAGRDYHNTLVELAEEMRAAPSLQQPKEGAGDE